MATESDTVRGKNVFEVIGSHPFTGKQDEIRVWTSSTQ